MLKAKHLFKVFPVWGLTGGFPEQGQKCPRSDLISQRPPGPDKSHADANSQISIVAVSHHFAAASAHHGHEPQAAKYSARDTATFNSSVPAG